jgi:hypothetical protein
MEAIKMKRASGILLISALALAIFFMRQTVCSAAGPDTQAPDEKAIASFVTVSGGIGYDRAGKSGYSEIEKEKAQKMPLFDSDILMTGSQTTAEIKVDYGAAVKMSENTELQLGLFNARMKKGAFWVNYKPVKESDGTYKFKVYTPVATIGVKGTIFMVKFDPETKKLKVGVSEGVVEVESLSGEEKRELKQFKMLVVEAEKPLPEPSEFSPAAEGFDAGGAFDQKTAPAEDINKTPEDGGTGDESPENKSGKKLIKRKRSMN